MSLQLSQIFKVLQSTAEAVTTRTLIFCASQPRLGYREQVLYHHPMNTKQFLLALTIRYSNISLAGKKSVYFLLEYIYVSVQ